MDTKTCIFIILAIFLLVIFIILNCNNCNNSKKCLDYNENENLVNNNQRYINHQNNDISKILDYVRKGQTNIAINLFKSLIQNNLTSKYAST